MLRRLARWFSDRARARRGRLLRMRLDLAASAAIVDIGGGDGAHIASIFPGHSNITIFDLDKAALATARKKGFTTILGDGTNRLPFQDGEFEFCFCSSVIEHVTGPKEMVCAERDDDRFRMLAERTQSHFAAEIRRVSKAYYVQTPYRYFPIESHTWLPAVLILLPRAWQICLISMFNGFWPKKTAPDYHLLRHEDMRRLFPEAEIVSERFTGLTKSLMAIRLPPSSAIRAS
jgi:Methyltransferase domain